MYLCNACGKMLDGSSAVLDNDSQLQQYIMQGEHKRCKERLAVILTEEVGGEDAHTHRGPQGDRRLRREMGV